MKPPPAASPFFPPAACSDETRRASIGLLAGFFPALPSGALDASQKTNRLLQEAIMELRGLCFHRSAVGTRPPSPATVRPPSPSAARPSPPPGAPTGTTVAAGRSSSPDAARARPASSPGPPAAATAAGAPGSAGPGQGSPGGGSAGAPGPVSGLRHEQLQLMTELFARDLASALGTFGLGRFAAGSGPNEDLGHIWELLARGVRDVLRCFPPFVLWTRQRAGWAGRREAPNSRLIAERRIITLVTLTAEVDSASCGLLPYSLVG